MTNQSIIESILIERENQNVKHPVLPKWFLSPGIIKEIDIKGMAESLKEINDFRESESSHDWFGILREELYETFAETDLRKMRYEAIRSPLYRCG